MCVCVGVAYDSGKTGANILIRAILDGKVKTKFKAPILTLAGCYQKYKYFDRKFH